MNKTIATVIGLILLVILILFDTTYSVWFNELAIPKRFGQADIDRVKQVHESEGLKMKLPFFVDQVDKFDKRLHVVETPLIEQTTSDGDLIALRAFLLWRVKAETTQDVESLSSMSSEREASEHLSKQLKTAVAAVGRFSFNQLIGPESELESVEDAILARIQESQLDGTRAEMVGISQILLPTKTSKAVLDRMAATAKQRAEVERSRASSIAQGIESAARYKADVITQFATTIAAEIESKGWQEAQQYLSTMNQSPELAQFLSWKDALEQMLTKYTTIVTPPDWAPFQLLDPSARTSENGIPLPRTSAEAE